MTCATCAARVEKALNDVDGADASVNFATEQATVAIHDGPAIEVEQLLDAVRSLGYGATPSGDAPAGHDELQQRDRTLLALRVIVAAVLWVPVMVVSMVDPLMFDGWKWAAAALTLPAVTWAAWPFHRATLVNLRHKATTMDTLISVGTTAAFVWSLVATVRGTGHVYFEVASGVTTFILAGRWAEQHAKRRAGDAIRALLDLGATEARCSTSTAPSVWRPSTRSPSACASSFDRERRSPPTVG